MVVTTVAAAVSEPWVAIRSARVSASIRGTSPEVTSTVPAKSAGSAVSPHADRVPGAALLVLHGDVDRAAQRFGQFGDSGDDALTFVSEDDDQVLRGDLGHRVQHVGEHAAAGERVQHLGDVRTHPRARAGGHHQDGGLGRGWS